MKMYTFVYFVIINKQ